MRLTEHPDAESAKDTQRTQKEQPKIANDFSHEVIGACVEVQRVLGVFVAYRDLDTAVWRGVAPLPAPKELGRFSIFNPSFESSYVKVYVGPNKVQVTSNVAEVPVPTGGSMPSMPSMPSTPRSLGWTLIIC